MIAQQFDVFLCHNSEDKAAVIKIAEQLRGRGIKPWLDVWELQPGAIWQYALEQQIESIGAVAVFTGQKGMGPWQSEEVYAFLQEFIRRKCPVIPVLLPEAQTQTRLPIFLKNRHWVDFRLKKPEPVSQLIWGITGEKFYGIVANSSTAVRKAEKSIQVSEMRAGVIHTDVERYLKNRQWRRADDETYRLLISSIGKREGYSLQPGDALRLPCGLIDFVDNLWLKNSKGKFGFSALGEAYSKVAFVRDADCPLEEACEPFYETVGWNFIKTSLEDDLSIEKAPIGYLPFLCVVGYEGRDHLPRGTGGVTVLNMLRELSSRLQTCRLLRSKLHSVGVRYADLENYLKDEQWKKADDETHRLMATSIGKDENRWLEAEDLSKLPSDLLKTIDGLWIKYSGGKFGFSVQKTMYLLCGGIPDGVYHEEAWEKFCHMNGWYRNGEFAVDTWATLPRGHLPMCIGVDWYQMTVDHSCYSLLSHPAL